MQVMQQRPVAPAAPRNNAIRWVPLLSLLLLLCATALWLEAQGGTKAVSASVAGTAGVRLENAANPDQRRQQCEASAGLAAQALAERGIDLRTAHWMAQRDRAIAACINDFKDLQWLQNPR